MCVCALFSMEIVQAGAVKGLTKSAVKGLTKMCHISLG